MEKHYIYIFLNIVNVNITSCIYGKFVCLTHHMFSYTSKCLTRNKLMWLWMVWKDLLQNLLSAWRNPGGTRAEPIWGFRRIRQTCIRFCYKYQVICLNFGFITSHYIFTHIHSYHSSNPLTFHFDVKFLL